MRMMMRLPGIIKKTDRHADVVLDFELQIQTH